MEDNEEVEEGWATESVLEMLDISEATPDNLRCWWAERSGGLTGSRRQCSSGVEGADDEVPVVSVFTDTSSPRCCGEVCEFRGWRNTVYRKNFLMRVPIRDDGDRAGGAVPTGSVCALRGGTSGATPVEAWRRPIGGDKEVWMLRPFVVIGAGLREVGRRRVRFEVGGGLLSFSLAEPPCRPPSPSHCPAAAQRGVSDQRAL